MKWVLGLVALPVLASPAIAQSINYPSVRVSFIDEPVCYIDIRRAGRFDLTSLCGASARGRSAQVSTPSVRIVPSLQNEKRQLSERSRIEGRSYEGRASSQRSDGR